MPFTTKSVIHRYVPLPPSLVEEDLQRRVDQEMRNLRKTVDSLTKVVEEMKAYLESQP